MDKLKKFLLVTLYCLCVAITTQPAFGSSVEILQTTNISSKIDAFGGLPKSVFIRGLSSDGLVVVGKYRLKQPPYEWQVFRYTQSGGIENLSKVWKKKIHDLCISADGLVIWGNFYTENDVLHIFRYTQSNGFQDFENLGKASALVHGVSGDGSVIVGQFLYSLTPENSPRYHAFRYSQSQRFEDLGAMGAKSAFAKGISADGSFVVGNFHVANGSDHAFLYSSSGGMQDIGDIDSQAAFADDISNDGSIVVGNFWGEYSFFRYKYYSHAFIYTKASGVRKLGAMGGRSTGVIRISTDGTRLFGSYKDSNDESFIYTANIGSKK